MVASPGMIGARRGIRLQGSGKIGTCECGHLVRATQLSQSLIERSQPLAYLLQQGRLVGKLGSVRIKIAGADKEYLPVDL